MHRCDLGLWPLVMLHVHSVTGIMPIFSVSSDPRATVVFMEENRARRLVQILRDRNVFAHVRLPRAGGTGYGIRVVLADGREAEWEVGAAGLQAQVMRNGVLVGFVETIPGSEHFTEEQIIETIAATDYDRPIGRSERPAVQRPLPPPPPTKLADRLRSSFRG
ncbi:hypothetical protein AMIS_64890 [Actinoplanes missouriensis 431]|uniref:Uncharacterized protein n=1 Tax=Actinoplanes missouriensis (strain ATCC 14538 / DSM 43046 / CBS 188.64 / JCM 3121 / NBRC 102363 / NCIMB 12654 / NRRL B-3342 / UNCC 431) TaxID=512565 RepID=I0HFC2_ACTM4|nr:hypothetical protein [Actinoplanes missouriensis]BAL91709.1 hypothetical protein AMIS_64890 [Actinoplanes missouriensis 431]